MKKLLYILPILFFVGCGSLKKDKSITETSKDNDIKTKSDVNLNYQFDKLSLEPYNPERPMLVNGKEYNNTKIIHHYEQGEKTEKTETEDKSKSEEFTKDKTVERDNTMLFVVLGLGALFMILGFFLILIIGAVLYLRMK